MSRVLCPEADDWAIFDWAWGALPDWQLRTKLENAYTGFDQGDWGKFHAWRMEAKRLFSDVRAAQLALYEEITKDRTSK